MQILKIMKGCWSGEEMQLLVSCALESLAVYCSSGASIVPYWLPDRKWHQREWYATFWQTLGTIKVLRGAEYIRKWRRDADFGVLCPWGCGSLLQQWNINCVQLITGLEVTSAGVVCSVLAETGDYKRTQGPKAMLGAHAKSVTLTVMLTSPSGRAQTVVRSFWYNLRHIVSFPIFGVIIASAMPQSKKREEGNRPLQRYLQACLAEEDNEQGIEQEEPSLSDIKKLLEGKLQDIEVDKWIKGWF